MQPVPEMTATTIPAWKSKPKKFEKYWNSYFCPIGGCKSGTALQKFSNHLTDVHCILDKSKRKELLAHAKEAGPIKRKVTITLGKLFLKTHVIPSLNSKQGSTNHFPCYNIDKDPLIMAFIAFVLRMNAWDSTILYLMSLSS